MTQILDPWIAALNDADINNPFLRSSVSLKVLTPAPVNVVYRWSVKVLRVSSPLKLKNTSYFLVLFEEEEEEEKAIWGSD